MLRFKICGRNNTKKWREDSESRGKGTGYTTEVTAELLASLEALRVYMFVGRPGGGGVHLSLASLGTQSSTNKPAGSNHVPTWAPRTSSPPSPLMGWEDRATLKYSPPTPPCPRKSPSKCLASLLPSAL